jgi:hypothetical protein
VVPRGVGSRVVGSSSRGIVSGLREDRERGSEKELEDECRGSEFFWSISVELIEKAKKTRPPLPL